MNNNTSLLITKRQMSWLPSAANLTAEGTSMRTAIFGLTSGDAELLGSSSVTFPGIVSVCEQTCRVALKLTTAQQYMPNLRLFDINEIAELLGRDLSWVRKLIYAGKLKTVAGSKRLVVSGGELERFVGTTAPYVPRHSPSKRKVAT